MKSNQKASSSKMSLPFGLEDWTLSFRTSMRSGMMQNGIVSQLPTVAPLTHGTEFGYLPTVSAREGKDWSRWEVLAKVDRGDGVAKRICNKSTLVPLQEKQIVGLNPSFAEWMFRYPEGWTDLSK
jgi:hypothetical protein